MKLRRYLQGALVANLVALAPSLADAQERRVPTAAAVAAAVRTDLQHNVRQTRELLLQVHAEYTPAELDQVVAALVDVATTSPDWHVVTDAVDILGEAATDTTHRRYAPAADALLEIALAGDHDAASELKYLPDRERALQYLRRVAVADPPAEIGGAVWALAYHMGPAGVEVLHELYRRELVNVKASPVARCHLAMLAEREGWADPSPGPVVAMENGRPVIIVEEVC